MFGLRSFANFLLVSFLSQGCAFATNMHPSSDNTGGTSSRLNQKKQGNEGDEQNILPQLPAVDPNNKDIPSIRLGETIRFEEYGPIILNTDGTTRRIANWENLTEKEKEVTWRRISKRNEERRQILLKQAEAQNEQSEEL